MKAEIMRGFKSTSLVAAAAVFLLISVGNSTSDQNHCFHIFQNQAKGIIDFPDQEKVANSTGTCVWIMEVQREHQIAFSIIQLNLGENDILIISDYSSRNATKLLQTRTSNSLAPGTVLFSESEVLRVELKFMEASKVTLNAVFEKATCGGILTSITGFIEVPLFAHLSPTAKTCSWRIQAPTEKLIKVSFLQFFLQPGSCIYENLIIKEDNTPEEQLIGDFCEESPPFGDVTSSSNVLTVEYSKRPSFTVNTFSERPVVKLHYELFDPCRSKMVGMFGSITVPAIDMNRKRGSKCSWEVQVPHHYRISLTFLKYTTAHRTHGGAQEIRLYDGLDDNNASLIWTTQGENLPPSNFQTNSNELRLELITIKNASKSNRISFNAVYQAHSTSIESSTDCINIGERVFYQCSNGHFIDCDWKCDGESDCDDGIDELFCSKDESGFAMSQVVSVVPIREVGGTLILVAVAGSAIIAFLFVVFFEKILKIGMRDFIINRESRMNKDHSFVAYQLPSLPSYSSDDPAPLTPPPAYQVGQMSKALFQCIQDSAEEQPLAHGMDTIFGKENDGSKCLTNDECSSFPPEDSSTIL